MNCKHSFISIGGTVKAQIGTTRGIIGVEAGCINCGQIRRLYIDGTVFIVKVGHKPIDQDHEETSNTETGRS